MSNSMRLLKWLASLLALFLLYEFTGRVIDVVFNPWAYRLTGQPAPDGHWRARVALPQAGAVEPAPMIDLTLDLVLEPHESLGLHGRIGNPPPDLVGRLVACRGGRAWPTAAPVPGDTNLQASAAWSGRDWTFWTTNAAFGAHGDPGASACRYDGQRFDCRLDFRSRLDPAVKARVLAIERKSGRNFQGFEVTAVFERVPPSAAQGRPAGAAPGTAEVDRCQGLATP